MRKLLILTPLLATACTTIPDSVVQRAYDVALATENTAALIRCPKVGKERDAFLLARAVHDAAFASRASQERKNELAVARDRADAKCGFTSVEADAAAASLR